MLTAVVDAVVDVGGSWCWYRVYACFEFVIVVIAVTLPWLDVKGLLSFFCFIPRTFVVKSTEYNHTTSSMERGCVLNPCSKVGEKSRKRRDPYQAVVDLETHRRWKQRMLHLCFLFGVFFLFCSVFAHVHISRRRSPRLVTARPPNSARETTCAERDSRQPQNTSISLLPHPSPCLQTRPCAGHYPTVRLHRHVEGFQEARRGQLAARSGIRVRRRRQNREACGGPGEKGQG